MAEERETENNSHKESEILEKHDRTLEAIHTSCSLILANEVQSNGDHNITTVPGPVLDNLENKKLDISKHKTNFFIGEQQKNSIKDLLKVAVGHIHDNDDESFNNQVDSFVSSEKAEITHNLKPSHHSSVDNCNLMGNHNSQQLALPSQHEPGLKVEDGVKLEDDNNEDMFVKSEDGNNKEIIKESDRSDEIGTVACDATNSTEEKYENQMAIKEVTNTEDELISEDRSSSKNEGLNASDVDEDAIASAIDDFLCTTDRLPCALTKNNDINNVDPPEKLSFNPNAPVAVNKYDECAEMINDNSEAIVALVDEPLDNYPTTISENCTTDTETSATSPAKSDESLTTEEVKFIEKQMSDIYSDALGTDMENSVNSNDSTLKDDTLSTIYSDIESCDYKCLQELPVDKSEVYGKTFKKSIVEQTGTGSDIVDSDANGIGIEELDDKIKYDCHIEETLNTKLCSEEEKNSCQRSNSLRVTTDIGKRVCQTELSLKTHESPPDVTQYNIDSNCLTSCAKIGEGDVSNMSLLVVEQSAKIDSDTKAVDEDPEKSKELSTELLCIDNKEMSVEILGVDNTKMLDALVGVVNVNERSDYLNSVENTEASAELDGAKNVKMSAELINVDSANGPTELIGVDNTERPALIGSVETTEMSVDIHDIDNTDASAEFINVDITVSSDVRKDVDKTEDSADLINVDGVVSSDVMKDVYKTEESPESINVDNAVSSDVMKDVSKTVELPESINVDNAVRSDVMNDVNKIEVSPELISVDKESPELISVDKESPELISVDNSEKSLMVDDITKLAEKHGFVDAELTSIDNIDRSVEFIGADKKNNVNSKLLCVDATEKSTESPCSQIDNSIDCSKLKAFKTYECNDTHSASNDETVDSCDTVNVDQLEGKVNVVVHLNELIKNESEGDVNDIHRSCKLDNDLEVCNNVIETSEWKNVDMLKSGQCDGECVGSDADSTDYSHLCEKMMENDTCLDKTSLDENELANSELNKKDIISDNFVKKGNTFTNEATDNITDNDHDHCGQQLTNVPSQSVVGNNAILDDNHSGISCHIMDKPDDVQVDKSGANSETCYGKPAVCDEKPETGDETPETCDEKLETCDETPETCDEKLETCDETPETCDEKLEMCDETPETCDEKPETCDETPETCDETPETCDETPETCDEKLETCDETPETCDEKLETCDETPVTCDEKPETCDETPESCDEKPEMCDEKSEMCDEKLETCDEKPENYDKKPEVYGKMEEHLTCGASVKMTELRRLLKESSSKLDVLVVKTERQSASTSPTTSGFKEHVQNVMDDDQKTELMDVDYLASDVKSETDSIPQNDEQKLTGIHLITKKKKVPTATLR